MNFFKNKRILLTGGGGFVGQHVKKELLKNGVLEKNIIIQRNNQHDLREKFFLIIIPNN